jgi:hypothetical protein
MAKTYYKYVERGTESQINWGEVGRSVSEMISNEAQVREQKKAAIDESSRQFGEVLANAPTGAFTTANEWTLNYANDASQALLLLDRQLKTGQISVKDYTVKRQNLNDSTNQMFELSKEYQNKYQEALERNQMEANSEAEMWFMTQIEGLSNFKDSKAYINPTNYQVSVGQMKQVKGANGENVMMLDSDPNNYKSLNQMRNYMQLKIDKYDYTKVVGEKVASLGEFIDTESIARLANIYRTYGITDIADPTKRPKFGAEVTDADMKNMSTFEAWEQSTINAQLANPYVAQSILVDNMGSNPMTGEDFKYTMSAEQAMSDPNYILFEDDGSGRPVPKLTDEQNKIAEQFLRNQIRNSIDQKSQTDTKALPSIEYSPYQKADAKANAGGGPTEKLTIYESANNALRTGNTSALNNDDYVYNVRTIDGRRVISFRPKTSAEKKSGKVTNNRKYVKGGSWKTLYDAENVAPYLSGVTSARTKYIEGKDEFRDVHGFTLFGKYLEGDATRDRDWIYSQSTYTEEERNRRIGASSGSGSGGGSAAAGDELFKP